MYEPDLLDFIEDRTVPRWEGHVWRQVLQTRDGSELDPLRPNTRGARWNPLGVEALYTSLDEQCAIREMDHLLAQQPVLLSRPRHTAKLAVTLASVVDLSNFDLLSQVGISEEDYDSPEYSSCQRVGGAAAFLECDGLLVPSARCDGLNLVVFVNNQGPNEELRVLSLVPYGSQ